MNGISPIDSLNEYPPPSHADRLDEGEPVKFESVDTSQAQPIEAAKEKLDYKTTVQGAQYTGKGSLIDKIF